MGGDGESEVVAATLEAEPPSAVGGLSSTIRCRRDGPEGPRRELKR
jgi:hypothetical protein